MIKKLRIKLILVSMLSLLAVLLAIVGGINLMNVHRMIGEADGYGQSVTTGINTAKLSSTEVEGMGYAIPISDVKDIINELKTQTPQQQTTVQQPDSTPMYYFFPF